MKNSHKIILFTLGLSIALNIGLGFNAIDHRSDMKYSTSRITNAYEQSLSSLTQRCTEIENSLSKLSVCSESTQAVRILTDIIDDASSAAAALNALPISSEYTVVLNKYFNQLEDYSKFMLYGAAEGNIPAQQLNDSIKALKTSVNGMNSALSTICGDTQEQHDWSVYLNQEVNELDMLSDSFFNIIEGIQTESIDYPTLIYDGPFADAVINKQITENGNKSITSQQATKIFLDYLGADSAFQAIACDEVNGSIPLWCVTVTKGNTTYYGSVSKATGVVVSFLCNNSAGTAKHTRDDAIKAARDFLSSHGYDSMVAQYCEVTNNIATVNFVYNDNGVFCYPDMVKLRVNLENCAVEGFEGLQYYANHKERDIKKPIADLPQELIPTSCVERNRRLAIIPTDSGDEELCYEVKCSMGGETFMLYFNVLTLKESKIFKIIYSENGDFVV